jgi:hypothetical protein
LGLTVSEVQNCAANTPMVNVLTMPGGLPNNWPTGVDFSAEYPTGSSTPTIYYDPVNFWQTSFAQLLGTLVHEYAHVMNMSASDQDLLNDLSIKSNNPSDISRKLAADCFTGVPEPTQQ